jgi:hypothetical protein
VEEYTDEYSFLLHELGVPLIPAKAGEGR